MYCLTLRHPWPWAVCCLQKRIENRRWRPPPKAVGERLLIHGGLVPREPGARREALAIARRLVEAHAPETPLDDLEEQVFARTGLVADCRLEKYVVSSLSPWFHGPFGWVLGDVVPFPEPVPCLGRQGLWEAPDALRERIAAAVEAGRRAKS